MAMRFEKRTIGIVFGIGVGVIFTTGGFLRSQHTVRVSVETLQRTPLPLVLRTSGVLQPARRFLCIAPFDGPVVRKEFREGQSVKQNQPLLEIGRERIRLNHENQRTALRNAEADAKAARKNLALQKML